MKLTEYYNLDNIIDWIKLLFRFVISPRKYYIELGNTDNKELLSQFFFYFILYTTFFIFINTDHSNENLLKHSTLTLIQNSYSLIPAFIIALIVFPKKEYKTIFLFMTSLLLVYTPVLIIMKSLFIITENYSYELGYNIFKAILFIYSNYLIVIVISKKNGVIFKFIILNYLLINFINIIFSFFSIDDYAPSFNDDPILTEYSEIVTPLKNLNELPSMLNYTYYKDSVYFGFGLTTINSDTIWKSETSDNQMMQYSKDLSKNLIHLENYQTYFKRNRDISIIIADYLKNIQSTIKQQYFYPIDLRDKGYKFSIAGLPGDTIIHYVKLLDMEDQIIQRQAIVNYHNELIKTKSLSEWPISVTDRAQYLLSDLILRSSGYQANTVILEITDFNEF
jgi:hypothetical protein